MADRTFATDSKRSREAFSRIVAPVLKPLLSPDPSTQIVSQEGSACPNCIHLDTMCGIDYLFIDFAKGIRGIASRIQWRKDSDRAWPYDTFTIRRQRDSGARTELEKLQSALAEPGWLRPALHVQAYATDDQLDSLAVVYTADLIDFIIRSPRARRTDNASFYFAQWADLAADGCRIRTWPKRTFGTARRPDVEGQVRLDQRPCVSCGGTPTRLWMVPESQQDQFGTTVVYCAQCEPFAGEALTAWDGE